MADFKSFLAQLRETIQRRQAKEGKKQLVQVDKMAEERNKNAYVSENFFVPKSRQQSRGRPDQQRRPRFNSNGETSQPDAAMVDQDMAQEA